MSDFQSADALTQQFRNLMQTRPWFVPKNLRNFKHSRIALGNNINAIGLPYDPNVAEGQIVHISDTLVVLKKLPSEYVIIDPALLPVGHAFSLRERVTLIPYARKSLEDFKRLDAPRSNGRGFMVSTMGNIKTTIPGAPASGYLADLVRQLEHLKMPDGYRTISNAFADWRAHDFVWVQNDQDLDYRLCFEMSAPGYSGKVTIKYHRVPDTYSVITHGADDSIAFVQSCYFDDLGEAFATNAGDSDSWFRIHVTTAVSACKAA